jgi:UDP-glucose 4-epimerase
MRVLVTGAGGPRGRLIAQRLMREGHQVVGIDVEPWPDPPPELSFHRLDHRKRGFEELMRHERFDGIVHLAVHAGFRLSPGERHRLNLEGTQAIVQLAAEHGVRKLVVASHASVYGALPDNPYFMTEEAPPSVGRAFPEMQDLVTADLLASAAMWQKPSLAIAVLRPVHSLGPTSRDVLAALLRRPRFPMVLGFDPMVQVMHEEDLARAFGLALGSDVRGVYNVAGPGEVPLSVLASRAGRRPLRIPGPLFSVFRGTLPFVYFPMGAIEFLKHPCLIDDARFRRDTGYRPSKSLRETIDAATG